MLTPDGQTVARRDPGHDFDVVTTDRCDKRSQWDDADCDCERLIVAIH